MMADTQRRFFMNMHFSSKGYEYQINDDILEVYKGKRRIMSVTVAPVVEGRQTAIGSWKKQGKNHFIGSVEGLGMVNIEIKNGYPCIWIDTKTVWFDNITYFPSIAFSGKRWTTFVSDELDRIWDIDEDVNVPVSSCYADVFHPDGHDGSGPMDPGDKPPLFNFNMHVRAAAAETGRRWTGIAVPGPIPVGISRFRTEKGVLSLSFEALRTTCRDWGTPEIYIITGLSDRDGLLDIYREISDSMGVTVQKRQGNPAWWANPVFDSWEEICRLLKMGSSENPDTSSGEQYMQSIPAPDYNNADKYITIENNVKWLDSVISTTGIGNINTTFEQGSFRMYGDYRPIDGLGGADGLRMQVDKWRAQGIHSAYYIHPFLVNTKTGFYKEHPEAFCRPKGKGYKIAYAIEFYDRAPEYALVDWTHPLGRRFMMDNVKFMLSDEPDCLNCDILRSNHWRGPDPRYFEFHDPDWGTGDLMSMKAQKLLYEEAKRIKPNAMVSKVGFADPYMQPWADMDYLSEEWSYNTDNWNRRARIATRTIRGCLFLVDPFVATLSKITETFTSFLVYSAPATTMVKHALHPQMFYRDLRQIDYRRRKSGFNVYMNAPVQTSDICSVDWNECGREAEISRKYTKGTLAGWYAARSFGRKCFVTYSEDEARIASCTDRNISVEIPPGHTAGRVTVIDHDGTEKDQAHRIRIKSGRIFIETYVTDCGKDAMYFRIKYSRNEQRQI
jgi:hypothetical protein